MRCERRSTSLSVERAAALRRRSGCETNTSYNRLIKRYLSGSFFCLEASHREIQIYHKGAIIYLFSMSKSRINYFE